MATKSRYTHEQRITRAHTYLMNHPEFCLFSGIFLLGKAETLSLADMRAQGKGSTACTDGLNVYYTKEFLDELDDTEVRGLVLHENMHKAYRHLSIWRHLYEKNARRANAACDYVINLQIYDADPQGVNIKLPARGLLDERFRGMDTMQVYRLLEQREKDGGGGTPDSLDTHDWQGASERIDSGEEEAISRQVETALRQGQIAASRKGASHTRELMRELEPQVRWEDVLAEFFTALASGHDYSTWSRPARRWVSQGVYMPSSVSESMGTVVVAIDTSGSIDNEMLSKFLSEVRAIMERVQPERIELLYWDHAVQRRETYEAEDADCLMQATRPEGGGGTDVTVVPAFLREHNIQPEAVVVLTDGHVCAGWGRWPCPLIVCCTTSVVAPVGTTVRVS